MCRTVIFEAVCPACGASVIWDHITTRLPCLEAKNNDAFGLCVDGAWEDVKQFEHECEGCETARKQQESGAGEQ